MYLNTTIKIDTFTLDNVLENLNFPCDGQTRLVMNDSTVYALTGKHFYDDRKQTYYGFKIIEDSSLLLGNVVILVNYEHIDTANN